MLFLAFALAASSPCSSGAIAGAAVVTPLQSRDPSELGLSNVDRGLQRPWVQEIAWSGPCVPTVVGLYGGTALVTAAGEMFWTKGGSQLEVRGDAMLPMDPEPAHPSWRGHHLIGSSSLAAAGWRVGTWVRGSGISDIARYRPDGEGRPIVLLSSAKPVVGIFYLGAPDSPGGTLFFAQRLGKSRFRMISLPWSEGGLRDPSQ